MEAVRSHCLYNPVERWAAWEKRPRETHYRLKIHDFVIYGFLTVCFHLDDQIISYLFPLINRHLASAYIGVATAAMC